MTTWMAISLGSSVLRIFRCKALKSLPPELANCESLKELDVRSDKKQTCKMTPEFAAALRVRRCNIRGGVIKKGKGGKKS